jgi:hypothetical protein
VPTQDERLAAIASAAAEALRRTPYHILRAKDVAAAVRIHDDAARPPGRSAVWLYNEVRNRRVLVALAASHAWNVFLGHAGWGLPARADSVTSAREIVAAAMALIVKFHRAERVLMAQVGYGIGDISTAEKRQLAEGTDVATPSWPDSRWGRVSVAAWHGRCGVFADFLQPVLWRCAQSITYMTDTAASDSAYRMSDIAFHICIADNDGPVERVAHGLAALWFERDLARLASSLPRDLECGEIALAAVARRGTDPRAEANARAVVIRVLLEAGTLYERCAREGGRAVALWRDLTETSPGGRADLATATPGDIRHDLERLSDAASHVGLAALRYGDSHTAEEAWELSRTVATRDLGDDRSRITRAENNLAELAAEAGRGQDAWDGINGVFLTRTSLLEEHPEDPAAWRRLTVTARTRVDVARLTGRVQDAVRFAADLLKDRRARQGELDDVSIADARLALGQALLVAGHPVEARRHIERANVARRSRFLLTSYRPQEDIVWLAKAAHVLELPRAVPDILADNAVITEWFCERVSFRLGFTARRLLWLAKAALGGVEQAADALREDADRLAGLPIDPKADPLAHDFERALGEVALLKGDAAGAASTLGRLADAEGRTASPGPAQAWTLVLLGRAADALGDSRLGAESFQRATGLTAGGVEELHPALLAARRDETARRAAAGDTSAAEELLAPLIDRGPLTHGRPALGEGHPLLESARQLAERLGVAAADTTLSAGQLLVDTDFDA